MTLSLSLGTCCLLSTMLRAAECLVSSAAEEADSDIFPSFIYTPEDVRLEVMPLHIS